MEKRNVIEEQRTPGFDKQAQEDMDEKAMSKLFKEKKAKQIAAELEKEVTHAGF